MQNNPACASLRNFGWKQEGAARNSGEPCGRGVVFRDDSARRAVCRIGSQIARDTALLGRGTRLIRVSITVHTEESDAYLRLFWAHEISVRLVLGDDDA